MASVEERIAMLEADQPKVKEQGQKILDQADEIQQLAKQRDAAHQAICALWEWIHDPQGEAPPKPILAGEAIPGLVTGEQRRAAWLSKREEVLFQRADHLEHMREEQVALIERLKLDVDRLQSEVHRLNGVPTDDQATKIAELEAEVARLQA